MPMASSQSPASVGQPKPKDEAAKIRVEFAININKQDDLAKIEEVLKGKVSAHISYSSSSHLDQHNFCSFHLLHSILHPSTANQLMQPTEQ